MFRAALALLHRLITSPWHICREIWRAVLFKPSPSRGLYTIIRVEVATLVILVGAYLLWPPIVDAPQLKCLFAETVPCATKTLREATRTVIAGELHVYEDDLKRLNCQTERLTVTRLQDQSKSRHCSPHASPRRSPVSMRNISTGARSGERVEAALSTSA